MKNLTSLVAALMLATPSLAQTTFPQPGQNIFIDGSHILVGSIPATVLGTNAPGVAGQTLVTDGTFIYWGSPNVASGTITVLTSSTIQNVNTFLFTTNAFPLSPGTTWDWSRYFQFISTNADFNVGAIAGLNSTNLNQAELQISNAGASQIICHLLFAMNKIGPNTTNDIYIASHKQAYANGEVRGIGTATNIVTLPEQ